MNKEITKRLLEFRKERDWEQFHDPKSLAGSIAIESTELLEIFQWTKTEDSYNRAEEKKEEIKSEVADILTYLTYFCYDLGIDMEQAVSDKLSISKKKYPVNKSKGNSKKYTEL